MSIKQESFVKQAAEHFTRGDYRTAREYYFKAATKYGYKFFVANVRLCSERKGSERKIEPSNAKNSAAMESQVGRTNNHQCESNFENNQSSNELKAFIHKENYVGRTLKQ